MFEIVNIVMTCNSFSPEVLKFPQRETKIGLQIVAPGFSAILHRKSGTAKVFCKSLEPPPFFADCRIDNIVAKTTMRAIPEEELIERLRAYGAADRAEEMSAVLFYTSSPTKPPITTTVRIFVKPPEYKVIMFSKSLQELRRIAQLLQAL